MGDVRVNAETMSEVAPESVPARLALVVGRMNRRLAGASGGLSHGLLMALATVAKHNSLRLAELAQLEMVSAPAVTRGVAELESRGLVSRSVDPADGRAFRIQVTPAGADAVLRARAARAEVVAELLRGLEPSDVDAIEAALPSLEKMLGLSQL
jgi:DNA-binding MarR family transcriptional regulator